MAESESSTFARVSEEDIATLLCDKDSVNTKRVTQVSIGVLQLYLQEKGQTTDFVSLSTSDLLKQFCVEAQRKSHIPSQVLLLYASASAIISRTADLTLT